jgi:hypothetical protein
MLTVAAVQPVAADTLTLAWDPSTSSNVAGYAVFVSTTPGSTGTAYDAGLKTSYSWTNAAAGQQYYFCVAAYYPGPVMGPCSAQISRYPDLAPTLQSVASQSTTGGTAVSLRLIGSDPEGATLTYGASNLPPGLQVAPTTGMISGTPTTAGSYAVTATVSDGFRADAKTFTWTIVSASGSSSGGGSESTGSTGGEGSTAEGGTSSGSGETSSGSGETSSGSSGETPSESTGGGSEPQKDATPPVLTITVPTSDRKYVTDRLFLNIGGTAVDNVGTKGVKWKSDRGFSGTATGTQTWFAAVPLLNGQNTITVTAFDEAGNESTKTLQVKFARRFFR